MSIQDINNAIRNPSEIKNLDRNELLSLIHKYPYCSTLHLLLIKLLHLNNSNEYQNQLSHTAAYANDRKALYRLIYETGSIKESGSSISSDEFSKHFSESVSTLLNQGTDVDTSTKALDAQNPNDEVQENIDNKESHALEELEAEHLEQIISSLQEDLNTLSKTGIGEVSPGYVVDEENDEVLADEHIDAEMQSIISVEHEFIEQNINEALKEEDLNKLSNALASNGSISPDNPISLADKKADEVESYTSIEQAIVAMADKQEAEVKVNNSETSTKSELQQLKKTFTQWLHTFKSEGVDLVKPTSTETSHKSNIDSSSELRQPQPTQAIETDVLSAQYIEEQTTVFFKETEDDLHKIIQEEIKNIDDFVQAQPVASQINVGSEVSVAELARRSLDDSQEIITETMARVFAAQGKFKRAIDILQKLELLHPEKRLYFAALIEEFKKHNI
jgi:hypothetical protein